MKLYYKLTTQDMKTRAGHYNEHKWELNKTYEITSFLQAQYAQLCSSSWFHVYSHPLLAVLLNPVHANIKNPKLFRCVGSGLHKSGKGLKEGFTIIKLTSEIELPKITLHQKIACVILHAKKIYFEKNFVNWADKWLKNIDRSFTAAHTAAYLTYIANTDAAYAAYTAAYTAVLAADAACIVNTVANAAAAAIYISNPVDLVKIIKKAVKYY